MEGKQISQQHVRQNDDRTPPHPPPFVTNRNIDPNWIRQPWKTRTTSEWRTYYAEACDAAGMSGMSFLRDHLYLTRPFDPQVENDCDLTLQSIHKEEASDADDRVMIFSLSYDHDEQGLLSQQTWKTITSWLRDLCSPGTRVQLWVDKVDSNNRTGEWGWAQLLPYVLFLVLRVGNPDREAGFWSNMEGLAGIFGRGLIHDATLHDNVIQHSRKLNVVQVGVTGPGQKVDVVPWFSKAFTRNCADAIQCFYVHLSYGCLANYRNHHPQALAKLSWGNTILSLVSGMKHEFLLDLMHWFERDQVSPDRQGKFEILNDFTCRTDLPCWQGVKEWITLDRFMHPVHILETRFRLKGFVNVYSNEEYTAAMIHWVRETTGWTRRLLVHLSRGSKECGVAISHIRQHGYRSHHKATILNLERESFSKSGLTDLYTFDSFNIRWDEDSPGK